MAKNIINGSDLMLFVEEGNAYKSLAFATSHSLSISADVADINTKDHGQWGGKEINKINWEISSENMFTVEGYEDLFDIMMSKTAVKVVFALKNGWAGDSPAPTGNETRNLTTTDGDSWTVETASATTPKYEGEAFITSLTANAAAGEKATYSVTLNGNGALSKVNAVSI